MPPAAAAILFSALPVLRGSVARAFDAALFAAALLPAVAILMFWFPARYEEASWNLNLLWSGALPLLGLILDRRGSQHFQIVGACHVEVDRNR